MFLMIKSDFFRARKSKGIWSALGILIIIVIMGVMSESVGSFGIVIEETIVNQDYSLKSGVEAVQLMLKQTNLVIYLLIAFFSFTGTDFISGTYKNTISTGFSRFRYALSKYTFTGILCTIFFVVYLIVAFLFGLVKTGKVGGFDSGSLSEFVKIIVYQLLILLAMNSFGTTLVFLLKKNGLSFAIYIILPIILQIPFIVIESLTKYIHFELTTGLNLIAYNQLPQSAFIIYPFWAIGVGIAFFLVGWQSFQKWDS